MRTRKSSENSIRRPRITCLCSHTADMETDLSFIRMSGYFVDSFSRDFMNLSIWMIGEVGFRVGEQEDSLCKMKGREIRAQNGARA